MKRNDFEKEFGPYGIKLSEYGGECYFGEAERCSLMLKPSTEKVSRAKLAIRTPSVTERKVVVNTFLQAAGLEYNSKVNDALEGHEYRGRDGSKNVTVAMLDDEFVVTVSE
jgi:hypothetical protein